MAGRKKTSSAFIIGGVLLLVVLFFLSIIAGTKALSTRDSLHSLRFIFGSPVSGTGKIILTRIRIPRTLAAFACGAGLSVSGLLLQSALNNTLASPGIMGINSGAGFFVLVSSLLFPFSAIARSALAFGGALSSVLAVYFISRKAGVARTTLILAGVAVSSLMSVGIDLIITLRPEIVADKVAFSLGGFQNLSVGALYNGLPVLVLAIAVSFFLADGIDLFELGDEAAYGLGLNVKFYRISSIVISGILAGAAVSICGLLGFVGLIIPNLIRLLGKNRCRTSLILCILGGGSFLLLCDLLARILFFPYELPVGLFLSALGAPFFIWMLIARRKKLAL